MLMQEESVVSVEQPRGRRGGHYVMGGVVEVTNGLSVHGEVCCQCWARWSVRGR